MVDSNDIRPILGQKACIGMGILVYNDNYHLNKPETVIAPVFAVKIPHTVMSKEDLVSKFPNVFKKGVGRLNSHTVLPISWLRWLSIRLLCGRLWYQKSGWTNAKGL